MGMAMELMQRKEVLLFLWGKIKGIFQGTFFHLHL
jgi:hypothetical protein